MYDLSPGITMRSTIPAYSYRHGLNFIPGIVKTRIDCYSGISNPSLIVMAPEGSPHFWQKLEPKASFTRMIYRHYPLRPANASLVIGEMGHVLGKLETWMSSNRLGLNPGKTKFMWFGIRQQLAKLNLDDLANKFPSYTFSAAARDLGALLDQELTFAPRLHRLSRDCYYQLRQLRTVARSLTASAASTLVHAFITSRLDYCSTLYTGLPACRLSCLERVMRSA